MAKGYSLHLGLNSVDPAHYEGWSGKLKGCENDARDMQAVAKALGYCSTTVLLTANATSEAFIANMQQLGNTLKKGDILFLTCSGHGGQIPDVDGDEVSDRLDETWLLYDRQLIDDELYHLFGQFAEGVRIAVLSDSCHSGTVIRGLLNRGLRYEELAHAMREAGQRLAPQGARPTGFDRVRFPPPEVLDKTYQAHKAQYRALQFANIGARRADIRAGAILISACLDNETALDGPQNGLFTQTFKEVWNDGAFQGDYASLRAEIRNRLVGIQTPNLMTLGSVTAAFMGQKPFTVEAEGAVVTPNLSWVLLLNGA